MNRLTKLGSYNVLKNLLKTVKPYNYENIAKTKFELNNNLLENCVKYRREFYNVDKIPYKNYNYLQNLNRNCENVVGYVRLPIGMIGPINVNNKENYIPFVPREYPRSKQIRSSTKVQPFEKCMPEKQMEQIFLLEVSQNIKKYFLT